MTSELSLQGIGIEEFYSNIRSIFRQELDTHPVAVPEPRSVDESLTLEQACDFMKIGLGSIHKLKRTGQLPFYKVGGRVYIKKSHCLAILAGNKVILEP